MMCTYDMNIKALVTTFLHLFRVRSWEAAIRAWTSLSWTLNNGGAPHPVSKGGSLWRMQFLISGILFFTYTVCVFAPLHSGLTEQDTDHTNAATLLLHKPTSHLFFTSLINKTQRYSNSSYWGMISSPMWRGQATTLDCKLPQVHAEGPGSKTPTR